MSSEVRKKVLETAAEKGAEESDALKTNRKQTDYEKICQIETLYQAHLTARLRKRKKPEVIRYEMHLSENLSRMSEQLKKHKYKMSGYYHFTIYEPKQREIYAAYYGDRVLLHAVCDEVLEPLIGPRLIYDNAACQKGKGTHFAMNRVTKFLREYYKKYGNQGYVLKCDIHKYFPSIDHEVLKKRLDKIIRDPDVKDLIFHYIDGYETVGMPGKGLPLGNQSSQWFAIYYLDLLDRYLKEQMQVKYYIRYMDDFILLHYDKGFLKRCLKEIQRIVKQELKMELNPKTRIISLHQGFEFIGWRFYLTDTGKVIRKIKAQSKTRVKRSFRRMRKEYAEGRMDFEQIQMSLASYKGYMKHGNTYLFQKKLFDEFVLKRNPTTKEIVCLDRVKAWVDDALWQGYIDEEQF